MQDTKSLSPEIRSLFDQIRSQAHCYNETFEQIKSNAVKLDELAIDVANRTADMELRINSVLESINYKIENSLRRLAYDTQRANDKYFILSEMEEKREKLENLQNELNASLDEFRQNNDEFNDYKKELAETVKSSKSKIDDDIAKHLETHKNDYKKFITAELQLSHSDLLSSHKQLEVRLKSVEKSQGDLLRQHSKELSRANSDIQDFKRIVASLSQTVTANAEKMGISFNEIMVQSEAKLAIIDDIIAQFDPTGEADGASKPFTMPGQVQDNSKFDKKLESISSRLARQNAEIIETDKKSRLAMNLAILAGAISVLVLVVSLML